MAIQKRSKVSNVIGEYTLKHNFWCSVELAFNKKRGDWDVILRRYPYLTGGCETVTGFFHTLEEAKACVERNKKNWSAQGIPFMDENGEFHKEGCFV